MREIEQLSRVAKPQPNIIDKRTSCLCHLPLGLLSTPLGVTARRLRASNYLTHPSWKTDILDELGSFGVLGPKAKSLPHSASCLVERSAVGVTTADAWNARNPSAAAVAL